VTSGELEARERILDAAARLIAVKGFAATTVRDIATAAGLNLAMIHYYFGNKDGLYRAIFEEKVFAVQRILAEAALSEGTSRARLERFVRAYAAFLCRHSHFARIVQHELLAGRPVLREVFGPQVARNYALLRGIVEDGVRSGEFRAVDTEITPVSIVGMIAFFLLAQPLISGFVDASPEQADFETRLADHTVSLLMNGILAPVAAASDDAGSPEPAP
jgi:AcrR family transcriptional regulator